MHVVRIGAQIDNQRKSYQSVWADQSQYNDIILFGHGSLRNVGRLQAIGDCLPGFMLKVKLASDRFL